ncbi:MAG TPA: pitrilysin family protein [Thermodesulfobacteriota bacterium]|nr:pitrilysin family protein [Thermodesulfobacteriota bacterium]
MSVITKATLASGIKLITEQMPEAESASIGVWVTTGSRNEPVDLGGVSHFIEHMLFKGTRTRTAHDISKEIERVGGVLNAFTGREYTCFYVKVLNKDIPRAADILSDIFMNSVFSVRELGREKKVVLQEIKMVEDTPDDIIHDLFAERFFGGHPLGRSILGTTESIDKLTRKSVLDYFGTHYRTNRVFITAAGGLSHRGFTRLIRETFGSIKPDSHVPEVTTPSHEPGVWLMEKDLGQVHLCLGVPVPPQSHPDRYKIYLLNTILGSGMSSRLFQKIREKKGLAYSVYSYLNLYRDSGSIVVYAGSSKESFPQVVSLVMREFSLLRKDVTASELEDAKSHLKGSMLLGLETSDNRMAKLARDEVYFGEVVPTKEIVREIDRVTVDDIKEMARKVLSPDKVTLVALGKATKKDLPASLAGML